LPAHAADQDTSGNLHHRQRDAKKFEEPTSDQKSAGADHKAIKTDFSAAA
jgi:hypothetical protein